MKLLYFIIISILHILISCTDNSSNRDFEFDELKIDNYQAVLQDLNQKKYVPYYRTFKGTNFDFDSWGINSNDSIYLIDSAFYYKSRRTFFNQDREFLHWLLSFKYDTSTALPFKNLWSPFSNPYSSTLSECYLSSTASRQAISLIYGFLDATNIECISCGTYSDVCLFYKYEVIELFLNDNNGNDIQQLRNAWQDKLKSSK